ncbi:epimerase family protein [Tribonema minus]|uniref:Epimerase family protein n=1 Tax=Tribonema minus TaxID=303371 RepID=A0A835Z991_9STRA|nr:epimerase family protein [Tribonema minus]
MRPLPLAALALLVLCARRTAGLVSSSTVGGRTRTVTMATAAPPSPVDSFLANLGFGKAASPKSAQFTIAVTGSSGLVGSALTKALEGAQLGGKPVKTLRLVRRAARSDDEVAWDPATGEVEVEKLEGIDALVHLAGEGVASGSGPLAILGRWNEAKKASIMDSRVKGTAVIAKAISQMKRPPKTFICSSGVGYYGYTAGDQEFDESGPKGGGFLAEVVEQWEAEALKVKGPRVVCLRTGVVLDPKGGALGKLLPLFKLAAGGNLGSGQQYFRYMQPTDGWVSLRDLLSIITFIAAAPGGAPLRGPINACAPAPCTNAQFTSALGAAVSRPAIVPLPAAVGSVLFGQMGEEMLFGGQKVLPKKLERSGFQFQDTDIGECLKAII